MKIHPGGVELFHVDGQTHRQTDRQRYSQTYVTTPWFLPNAIIRNDLSVTTIRQEVNKKKHCNTYRQRLTVHPNHLATTLFQGLPCNRRIKGHYPEDLVTRFNY